MGNYSYGQVRKSRLLTFKAYHSNDHYLHSEKSGFIKFGTRRKIFMLNRPINAKGDTKSKINGSE